MNTNSYSKEERNRIANVMLAQMGGRKFVLMTGGMPERIYERDNKVVLRTLVGRNCHSINRFEIAYNEGVDLYELRFIRTRKNVDKVVSEHCDVYADMLGDIFTQETGMATTMPRMMMV